MRLVMSLLCGLLLAAPASATPRLELEGGGALSHRQAEAWLAPALRAPRDSSALVAALGQAVAELQALGHLDARVQGTWAARAGEDDVLRVVVDPGERYRITSLILDAPASGDSLRFASALGVPLGSWASPRVIRAAIERAVRQVSDHGYPYAQLGVSSWTWDSAGARLRLSGTAGPRVTVSDLRIEGLRATRPSLARRSLGKLAGLDWDRATAEAARDRLAQLGLFESVAFEGLEGEGDWSRARLVYRVVEPHYNRFEGAVGMQGQRQAVGLANLELDNIAGSGRAAALRWESRGQGIAEFAARYAEPLLLGAPVKAQVGIEQHLEDTLYTRTRAEARLQFLVSRDEKVEAGVQEERVVQPHDAVEEADLQTTTFALERDARDDRVAPRHGVRARLEAGQSWKSERLRPLGKQKARASAIEASLEWHHPLARSGGLSRAGLALELSGASRFSSQRVLPLFERYAVGGAASLRGHDEQEFRVDRYALSRLEWRWFLGAPRQHLALFWDHAFLAAREALPEGGDRLANRQEDGVGFGLRLDTGAGWVGLDYGLAPGRPVLEGKLHLKLLSTF